MEKEELFSNICAFKDLFQQEVVWGPLIDLKKYISLQPLGNIEIDLPQGIFVGPDVSIGKGTVLEPGCFIQGPCIIRENCIIRHGAYIRDNVLIADNCVIGHATEIKHSILLEGSKAAHFAYVGDSIIGQRVNLGAGVKCANFRLDEKEIEIFLQGKRISTGLKKFGALLGDDVQIGCNAVLNPGTIMGKKAKCYPCINIGGVIPPNQLAKPPWRKHAKR